MRLEFCRRIFQKYSDIKFHEYLYGGSHDRRDEAESLSAIFLTGLNSVKMHETFFFREMVNSVTVCHKTGRRFRSNQCRKVCM